eukprot:UN03187
MPDPTIEDKYNGKEPVIIDGATINVDFYDTAGLEEYRNQLLKGAVSDSDAFMFVYSVDDVQGFKEIPELMDILSESKSEQLRKIPCVLVCNKIDLEQTSTHKLVNKQDGRKLASRFGSPGGSRTFLETSATQGTNVDSAFRSLLGIAVKMEAG